MSPKTVVKPITKKAAGSFLPLRTKSINFPGLNVQFHYLLWSIIVGHQTANQLPAPAYLFLSAKIEVLAHTEAQNPNSQTSVAVGHQSVSCKHDAAGQEGVFFPISDSLHSSLAARPIYSKWPKLNSHGTSRNGSLHHKSPFANKNTGHMFLSK